MTEPPATPKPLFASVDNLDDSSIMLADEDLSAIVDSSSQQSDEGRKALKWPKASCTTSIDSIPSLLSDQFPPPSQQDATGEEYETRLITETAADMSKRISKMCFDESSLAEDDPEEKAKLIAQVTFITHPL